MGVSGLEGIYFIKDSFEAAGVGDNHLQATVVVCPSSRFGSIKDQLARYLCFISRIGSSTNRWRE